MAFLLEKREDVHYLLPGGILYLKDSGNVWKVAILDLVILIETYNLAWHLSRHHQWETLDNFLEETCSMLTLD